ncbi:hypothetical protein NDI85_21095 [Halomicroarcula sp. S1AR25-4]|uniref:hypothetical protein n=1 Tax=Haloarcula sp. S1AR25-4 TaxID=2950538 RepID=UPI00287648DC|nr:hypothetical protein [Halomicroarcula sp. S1AR25-4]MDS0280284.1 hypothetical protein [Halomicroarcula sp. S1AR25-4]
MTDHDLSTVRVHASGPTASVEVDVQIMDHDTLESYLDGKPCPTLDEAIDMLADHVEGFDRDALGDLPVPIIQDLLAHVTPDPPCGPHPDDLVSR